MIMWLYLRTKRVSKATVTTVNTPISKGIYIGSPVFANTATPPVLTPATTPTPVCESTLIIITFPSLDIIISYSI